MANEGNLKPFKKGQSGNPKGRPKRLFQQMKGKGYSKDDVRACYASLADCTKDELNKLINDSTATALEVAIARAYVKAMAKGEYRLIKDIIELFADKANQTMKTDITSNGDKITINLNDHL